MAKQFWSKAAALLKKNANIRFIVFLTVIACIYIIFFTSKLWLHTEEKETVLYTAVGTSLEYCGHTVTLNSWTYAEKTHEMQVRLSIIDSDYTGQNDFTYSAMLSDGTELEITMQAETEIDKVIRITNVPDEFEGVSIRIMSESAEKRLKLYTMKDYVETVDSVAWYDDYKWYQRDDLINETASYEILLEEEKAYHSELGKTYENCQELIDSLNEQYALATAEEKPDILSRLTSESGKLETIEREISSSEDTISEYEVLIKRDQSLIKSIESGEEVE